MDNLTLTTFVNAHVNMAISLIVSGNKNQKPRGNKSKACIANNYYRIPEGEAAAFNQKDDRPMRKYLKIIMGLLRLLLEELLNGFRIKVHGISYCISSGVKFWIHKGSTCDLGKKTWLSENCILGCNGGEITLGYNNFFNTNCRVACQKKIIIGDNNLFGPNVIIVDHNHVYSDRNKLICKQGFTSNPIIIGSNVWIGGNTTICQGVTIVNDVVVGANSVVTSDCSEPGVYAGNPARKIKDLYDE